MFDSLISRSRKRRAEAALLKALRNAEPRLRDDLMILVHRQR